jgi:hypothetical protein
MTAYASSLGLRTAISPVLFSQIWNSAQREPLCARNYWIGLRNEPVLNQQHSRAISGATFSCYFIAVRAIKLRLLSAYTFDVRGQNLSSISDLSRMIIPWPISS